MKIQILPLKNGSQAIYRGITLAGSYIPDKGDKTYPSYELPVGTFELVKTTLPTDTNLEV